MDLHIYHPNRAGRRLEARRSGKRATPHRSTVSMRKCERFGCTNAVGVVTVGQHKRFCSDDCRKQRHRRRIAVSAVTS